MNILALETDKVKVVHIESSKIKKKDNTRLLYAIISYDKGQI